MSRSKKAARKRSGGPNKDKVTNDFLTAEKHTAIRQSKSSKSAREAEKAEAQACRAARQAKAGFYRGKQLSKREYNELIASGVDIPYPESWLGKPPPAQHKNDEPKPSLMRIDKALRLKIFGYVAADCTFVFPRINSIFDTTGAKPLAPSLALVCKEVCREFMPQLYAHATFSFGNEERSVRWVIQINDEHKDVLAKNGRDSKVLVKRPKEQRFAWEVAMTEAFGGEIWEYVESVVDAP